MQTSATSGGIISSDGGSPVISKGVCWSEEPEPTMDDNQTDNGSGKGSFSSDITNLRAGTNYYVRAYALNAEGISYGNEIEFTTPEVENKIYNGDVLLIANHQVNFFKEEEYTEISGTLTIGSGFERDSTIIDLRGLVNLTKVGKSLVIQYNKDITSLDGLDNLASVGGGLMIFKNKNTTIRKLKIKEV